MTTKRGRPSTEDRLAVVPISGARLAPHADLTTKGKKFWTAIVNSLPPDYFRPADVPLLYAYCAATEIKEQADMAVRRNGILINGKANPAIKVGNQQGQLLASLAVKLRLCPSTRLRASSAKLRRAHSGGGRPWETAE